jgi:hypothetical protein
VLQFGVVYRPSVPLRLTAVGTSAVVIVLLFAGAARPARENPISGTGLVTSNPLAAVAGTNRYSILIVAQSEARAAAREPGRSLVYFAGTDVNTRWSTGVPYPEAAAHGWLLKDASGQLLVNKGYPDNFVGDVGDPAYQQAWVSNVLRFLRAHGDDGVFIDDVLRDLVPLAGTEAAKYPSQQAWAAAQLSFVAAVGQVLRAHGYYVLVNASGYIPGDLSSDTGGSTAAWWRQLAPYVSGLLNEYYQQISDGSNTLRASGGNWNQNWDGWERLVTTAQSLGKDFVGVAYGSSSDTHQMSYGKASFLLDWNGGGGAFIYQPSDSNSNPWNPAWTANIGRPAAPKQRVGNGWLRRYSAGVALLNPSPTDSQSFQLAGNYLTPDGQTINQITLPPTTGLILRGERGSKRAGS